MQSHKECWSCGGFSNTKLGPGGSLYDPDPAAKKEVEPSFKKAWWANVIDTVAVDKNVEIIDDENVNVNGLILIFLSTAM